MNPQGPRTRGFCPGVWQPMQAGDGWIVRVRPVLGRMAAHRVSALATLSQDLGNGVIELTRRGNLQLRGISEACLPRLRAELTELGLADASVELERRPQLVISPLSGLDPRCPPLEGVAGAIEAVICRAAQKASFAAKFALVLSGGDRASAAITADVHVRLDAGRPGFAALALPGSHEVSPHVHVLPLERLPSAIEALLDLAAEAGGARVRDLVRQAPGALESALQHAGAERLAARSLWAPPGLGLHVAGGASWATLGVPFGSAETGAWLALAQAAERWGAGEVRFGNARDVVLPGVESAAAAALEALAHRDGFALARPEFEPELIACSGAPACRSAYGETRPLAIEIGAMARGRLAPGAAVHVSGCEKGCACRSAAAVTVVRTEGGFKLAFDATVARAISAPVRSLAALRGELARFVAQAGPHA